MFCRNVTAKYRLYAKSMKSLPRNGIPNFWNTGSKVYTDKILQNVKIVFAEPRCCGSNFFHQPEDKTKTSWTPEQMLNILRTKKQICNEVHNVVNSTAHCTSGFITGALKKLCPQKLPFLKKNESLQEQLNNSFGHNERGNPILKSTAVSSKHFVFGTAALTFADESSTGFKAALFPWTIPEPPPVPDPALEILRNTNALGEPTLSSLGLGGWSPIGMVQQTLEFFHVTLDIPWWQAIVLGTIIVRTLVFPLVVLAQRNAAKMNNSLPKLQALQVKMTEARQTGNHLETARYSQEMLVMMKDEGISPFKNLIVPLAQMPLFVSFFMGLRSMTNLPVDSLHQGGMFWFTDLTVPDQYFALPIITSLTLWATIELGTDSARLSAQNLKLMKYFLRALPVIILPFIVNFPSAILCYWVSSNFISLIQVAILKIPKVRTFFKIDPLIVHQPENLPIKNKGFVGDVKDSWTNMKLARELEDRRKYDELQFTRAGKGPIVKTYKSDPTKQVNNSQSVLAKQR